MYATDSLPSYIEANKTLPAWQQEVEGLVLPYSLNLIKKWQEVVYNLLRPKLNVKAKDIVYFSTHDTGAENEEHIHGGLGLRKRRISHSKLESKIELSKQSSNDDFRWLWALFIWFLQRLWSSYPTRIYLSLPSYWSSPIHVYKHWYSEFSVVSIYAYGLWRRTSLYEMLILL